MIAGIKIVLKTLIRLTGFELRRIPERNILQGDETLDLGRLKNHYPYNDLLKHSDHKEMSNQFISKLATGKYNLLDRNCMLCGGAFFKYF